MSQLEKRRCDNSPVPLRLEGRRLLDLGRERSRQPLFAFNDSNGGRKMRSTTVATKSAVIALALAGTALAFVVGAQAGAILNGRVMAVSVAKVPMPVMANPATTPAHTHVR
jgi:hypothetical protein